MKSFIGEILKSLCTVDFAGICKFTVAGNRPSATDRRKEFIVIRTSNSCYDHNVFQRASIFVSVFVKNLEGGLENTERLDELVNKVLSRFPILHKENGVVRWSVTKPQLVLRGDDELGFSEWTIRGLLNINTTDNFQINKV